MPRVTDPLSGVPQHDHSDPLNGGKLSVTALAPDSGIVVLDPDGPQQFSDDQVVIPWLRIPVSGTLDASEADVVSLPSSYGMQVGDYSLNVTAETLTDNRTVKDPDASGTRTVSKTIVTRTGKTGSDAAVVILTTPEAGLYLLAWYVEVTTADATAVISLDLSANPGGGALSQTVLTTEAMATRRAKSGLVVVYVASGNVTGSTTVASIASAVVYDWRVIPIGRIA